MDERFWVGFTITGQAEKAPIGTAKKVGQVGLCLLIERQRADKAWTTGTTATAITANSCSAVCACAGVFLLVESQAEL
jgi:hypothetical protein